MDNKQRDEDEPKFNLGKIDYLRLAIMNSFILKEIEKTNRTQQDHDQEKTNEDHDQEKTNEDHDQDQDQDQDQENAP